MTLPKPKPSDTAIGAARAVLAKVSSYEPVFPHPTEAMILAWAEQFAIANIAQDQLLFAVARWFATPRDKPPKPADILALARAGREERFQRSGIDSEERLGYEDRCDFKAGYPVSGIDDREGGRPVLIDDMTGSKRQMAHRERMALLVGKFGSSPEEQAAADIIRKLVDNPMDTRCPWCKAAPGSPCVIPGSFPPQRLTKGSRYHDSRLKAARGEQVEDAPEVDIPMPDSGPGEPTRLAEVLSTMLGGELALQNDPTATRPETGLPGTSTLGGPENPPTGQPGAVSAVRSVDHGPSPDETEPEL